MSSVESGQDETVGSSNEYWYVEIPLPRLSDGTLVKPSGDPGVRSMFHDRAEALHDDICRRSLELAQRAFPALQADGKSQAAAGRTLIHSAIDEILCDDPWPSSRLHLDGTSYLFCGESPWGMGSLGTLGLFVALFTSGVADDHVDPRDLRTPPPLPDWRDIRQLRPLVDWLVEVSTEVLEAMGLEADMLDEWLDEGLEFNAAEMLSFLRQAGTVR